LHAADSADDLAKIRNVVAATTGVIGGVFALMTVLDARQVVKAVPALMSLIGAAVVAVLSVIEWRAS
jgi:hypothetical protein